uniref:Uncharacterized protein n=1 Tax=Rhizophora mucronata TaxID=61149 RepID=A0A2P2NIJ9_RHIMU
MDFKCRITDGFFCKSMTLSSSCTLWYNFFLGLLPPLDTCLTETRIEPDS